MVPLDNMDCDWHSVAVAIRSRVGCESIILPLISFGHFVTSQTGRYVINIKYKPLFLVSGPLTESVYLKP
jgi:hypothetical protein